MSFTSISCMISSCSSVSIPENIFVILLVHHFLKKQILKLTSLIAVQRKKKRHRRMMCSLWNPCDDCIVQLVHGSEQNFVLWHSILHQLENNFQINEKYCRNIFPIYNLFGYNNFFYLPKL